MWFCEEREGGEWVWGRQSTMLIERVILDLPRLKVERSDGES